MVVVAVVVGEIVTVIAICYITIDINNDKNNTIVITIIAIIAIMMATIIIMKILKITIIMTITMVLSRFPCWRCLVTGESVTWTGFTPSEWSTCSPEPCKLVGYAFWAIYRQPKAPQTSGMCCLYESEIPLPR